MKLLFCHGQIVKLRFYRWLYTYIVNSVHVFHALLLLVAHVDSNDILACQMTQALDLVCPLMMTVSHNQPRRKIDGDEVWIAPLVFLLFAADNGNVNDGDSLGFGRS